MSIFKKISDHQMSVLLFLRLPGVLLKKLGRSWALVGGRTTGLGGTLPNPLANADFL
jgi:hypothetical protein